MASALKTLATRRGTLTAAAAAGNEKDVVVVHVLVRVAAAAVVVAIDVTRLESGDNRLNLLSQRHGASNHRTKDSRNREGGNDGATSTDMRIEVAPTRQQNIKPHT